MIYAIRKQSEKIDKFCHYLPGGPLNPYFSTAYKWLLSILTEKPGGREDDKF